MTLCPTAPIREVQHCLIGLAETALLIALLSVVITLGLLLVFALPQLIINHE